MFPYHCPSLLVILLIFLVFLLHRSFLVQLFIFPSFPSFPYPYFVTIFHPLEHQLFQSFSFFPSLALPHSTPQYQHIFDVPFQMSLFFSLFRFMCLLPMLASAWNRGSLKKTTRGKALPIHMIIMSNPRQKHPNKKQIISHRTKPKPCRE